jgi:hypothetical protein
MQGLWVLSPARRSVTLMTKGRVKDNSAGVGLEVVISISINGILVGIRILLANCGVFGGGKAIQCILAAGCRGHRGLLWLCSVREYKT